MSAAEVAVVLVAGQGTRLRPLTNDRPKALVDVGGTRERGVPTHVAGETILGRAVRLLAAAGVRDLVVATGYRADAIHAALSPCPMSITYCHNAEYARTQNSVSLRLCADAVGARSFFKLDGDVLFHPAVLSRLNAGGAPICAAVDLRPGLGAEEMKVLTGANGAITAFGKGLSPSACAGESIGIERIDAAAAPALFEALARASAEGRVDLYYEAIYGELIAAGMEARAVDVTDLPWTEVDTPEDLAHARALVASGKLDSTPGS